MKGTEINVSEVANSAINAELVRRERPGVADLVARLTLESDRRGAPYREGFFEGQRWARTCAAVVGPSRAVAESAQAGAKNGSPAWRGGPCHGNRRAMWRQVHKDRGGL
jgi:hypothetical protein